MYFWLFQWRSHKYTFENICLEDSNIKLKDDTRKIVLNTKGYIKDLNSELLEFLSYVENSSDEVADNAEGTLVKNIHKRVNVVKRDKNTEVEFMTLLERDREKIEEGEKKKALDIAKNLLDILDDKVIAEKTGLSIDEVRKLRKI